MTGALEIVIMGVTNLLLALNICVRCANLTPVNYHQLAEMVNISLSGHGLSVFTLSLFEFPPLHQPLSFPQPHPSLQPILCGTVHAGKLGRKEGGCGLLVIN